MSLCQCGCGGLAPLAKQTSKDRGHVKGQPTRFIHGHSVPIERFRLTLGGCWLWLGTKKENGYAAITRNGRRRYAHRVYYERINGPIPEGLDLDHLCRNRACVNPAHLEAVTHAENMRRGIRSKLNMGAAETIRERWQRRDVERPKLHIFRELGAEFGVSHETVRGVVEGRTWVHA